MKNVLLVWATVLTLGSSVQASGATAVQSVEDYTKERIRTLCADPEVTKHIVNSKELCEVSTDGGITWKTVSGMVLGALALAGGAAFMIRRHKKMNKDTIDRFTPESETQGKIWWRASPMLIGLEYTGDQSNIPLIISRESENSGSGTFHSDLSPIITEISPAWKDVVWEEITSEEIASESQPMLIPENIAQYIAAQSSVSRTKLQNNCGFSREEIETVLLSLQNGGFIGPRKWNGQYEVIKKDIL